MYGNHERLVDIAIVLIIIGLWILIYAYGKYQYNKGLHDGLNKRRMLNREIRRGNMYRLK